VDYAILMTSRFQEELKKDLGRTAAIRMAAVSSSASIVTSALVLFCATLGVSFVVHRPDRRYLCDALPGRHCVSHRQHLLDARHPVCL